MKAYILVKLAASTDIAKTRHALQQPGITSVEVVLGPWDAIVSCEAQDLSAIGRIAQQVRTCPGVADSLTCPVI